MDAIESRLVYRRDSRYCLGGILTLAGEIFVHNGAFSSLCKTSDMRCHDQSLAMGDRAEFSILPLLSKAFHISECYHTPVSPRFLGFLQDPPVADPKTSSQDVNKRMLGFETRDALKSSPKLKGSLDG